MSLYCHFYSVYPTTMLQLLKTLENSNYHKCIQ